MVMKMRKKETIMARTAGLRFGGGAYPRKEDMLI